MADWTYRCEYVCCGRCKTRCAHGPYWYRYRREGKKVKKEYCGKDDPRVRKPTPEEQRHSSFLLLCEAILHKQTATELVAISILGIDYGTSRDLAFKAYRQLQLQHHPDRGGSTLASQGINAAWSYLKAWHRW